MPHPEWLYTRLGKVIVDALTLCAALGIAYLIRFEAVIPAEYVAQLLTVGPYVVLLTLGSLGASGTYNRVWRYTNLRDAMLLPAALGVSVMILVVLRLVAPDSMMRLRVPLSVIAAYFVIAFVGTAGVRATWRLVYERRRKRGARPATARKVLIVGAGDTGIRLVRDLAHRDDAKVVGFLDDDIRKARTTMLGVRVRGTTAELARAVVAHQVDEVIVACSLPDRRFRSLIDECEAIPVRLRVLAAPDGELTEHVSGRLREVRIEDLLARQIAVFDPVAQTLVDVYRGRRVLVTGAGGSIGSELCRKLLALHPQTVLLLDHDENNLFETHADLVHLGARRDQLVQLLADVRQAEAMRRVFDRHRPEVILHAAAFKHVPFLEQHPLEAVENNVLATATIVDLAVECNARAFVLISTDKAVHPTSVMGASKRAAEIAVQQAAGRGVRVSCVRFGNVLNSRGSVVPIFRRQIARGGPVTVTHPDATRYFMTISEAAQLVLQAGSLGRDGEVFVFDMGERIRIVDLARDLIRLAGLKEPDDIEIRFVGLRSGERLHEQLTETAAELRPTPFHGILVASVAHQPGTVARRVLRQLTDAIARHDVTAVMRTLADDPIRLQGGDVPAALPDSPVVSHG